MNIPEFVKSDTGAPVPTGWTLPIHILCANGGVTLLSAG